MELEPEEEGTAVNPGWSRWYREARTAMRKQGFKRVSSKLYRAQFETGATVAAAVTALVASLPPEPVDGD